MSEDSPPGEAPRAVRRTADPPTSTPRSRRGALAALIALGATGIAAVVGVPAVQFALSPILRRRAGASGAWQRVAALEDLRSDVPTAAQVIGDRVDAWTVERRVRLGTVWLRKKSDTEVLALSAECPHLGCRIGCAPSGTQFVCPCHESSFDLEGTPKEGPSPRAMDALECRVRDGVVEVKFERFRTQSRARTRVG